MGTLIERNQVLELLKVDRVKFRSCIAHPDFPKQYSVKKSYGRRTMYYREEVEEWLANNRALLSHMQVPSELVRRFEKCLRKTSCLLYKTKKTSLIIGTITLPICTKSARNANKKPWLMVESIL